MFEWLTGLYYVNTNIAHLYPSQLIDQLALAGAGQSIDLVTIIIHFLRCIASRTSQTGPATTLLTMYFFSQYCRQYSQEIFSTILSTTYFLSGLCVWRIYVYFLIICYDIWRSIYHKISLYFLITCWMLQVLKVLDWWFILINLLIDNLSWSGLIDQRSSQVFATKNCTIIIGESVAKLKTEILWRTLLQTILKTQHRMK